MSRYIAITLLFLMTLPLWGQADSVARQDNAASFSSITIGAGGALTMPIEFVFYNGGSALAENQTQWFYVPQACSVSSWFAGADQSGSVVVDLWVDSHANFPPTNADSITASATPTLSTAQTGSDSTLTGWTTAIAAGSWIRATIEGTPTSITQLTLSVQCDRT